MFEPPKASLSRTFPLVSLWFPLARFSFPTFANFSELSLLPGSLTHFISPLFQAGVFWDRERAQVEAGWFQALGAAIIGLNAIVMGQWLGWDRDNHQVIV